MNRTGLLLRISALSATTLALGLAAERDAKACGGCFHPPTQTASDITDERMLLSVSPTQTTLYDQIQYAGSPSSFAWVLPIHGTVTVGLSADVLFDSIDELTATQITAPNVSCPVPQNCQGGGFGASAPSAGGASDNGGVTVTKSQNVGPYATVQLHATDSSALNTWLTDNGFSIPANVTPVIDQYVTEGFDFLAMKLLPNQGVQAMRPVRVTTTGASLSLPLRMAAVGTGASVGITIWVVSDGRYEPQNFPAFHIDDKDLVWDWSTNSSNYTTLRKTHEDALGGKGWEIESSLALNQELIKGVILSGGVYYGGFGGGASSAPPPSDPSLDYLPVGDPTVDGGASETAEQVRTDDVNALFAGITGPNARVTRMRSDISHAAMTTDFIVQASADQSELSNVRYVTESVNLQCPIYSSNTCGIVGYGAPPASSGSSSGATGSTASGHGGCVASPQPTREPMTAYGVIAGALGLVVTRLARRRRSPRKSS